MPSVDPLGQPLDVGHEQIVADQLDALAELVGQHLPAVPFVLGHAVLDRGDRIVGGKLGEEIGHSRPDDRLLPSPTMR